jgi:excisionase family DNA binding protein
MTPLISPKEAAQRLGVSVKTLHRLVDGGKLGYIDVGTAKRAVPRFSEDHLSAFVKRQERWEVQPCQSTDAPKQASGATTSGKAVSGFLGLSKPSPKKKPKQKN